MPMDHVLLDKSTCGVSFVTVKVPEFILVDIYIRTLSYEPYHRSISSRQGEPYHTIYLYSCINESWRLYGEG
ncbi:hypothetical protein PAHAL_8G262100 [Panicum hallii]|uniref:Uncharacterized protein n=1 Tax=Panicum hallii TaxID=206008 RepID=A0A2T8IAB8_9POAL|nr:hypothetical protein PAHAL_8G262100 [Panicum hallii]